MVPLLVPERIYSIAPHTHAVLLFKVWGMGMTQEDYKGIFLDEEKQPNFIERLKAKQLAAINADNERPIDEIVTRIVTLMTGIAKFWSNCAGWAPDDAADMLAKSRLDRLASMAETLRRWTDIPPEEISDGDLILAWTNLGSLVEGTLKLFLCVYLTDYKADDANTKKTQAFHQKKQLLLDPDGLRMDVLISYFEQADILPEDELELAKRIQMKRNTIHVFKDLDIGCGLDFHAAVKDYRQMLLSINSRLPYPDEIYEPRDF